MMAHDATPDPPHLSEASITMLRSAMQAYVADRDLPALETALHQVSVEAREKKVLAEQLLVVLKDLWFSLPEIRATGDSEEQTRLLQRVVTLCIRAYYSV
jgi:hypothetical protein